MEQKVYTTRPSQVLAFDAWFAALLGAVAMYKLAPLAMLLIPASMADVALTVQQAMIWGSPLPFLGAVWRNITLYCTVYEVSDQRVICRTGVLSVHYDEIEIIRVRDYIITQPFYLRVMGLGNLTIVSADPTTPRLKIKAQRHVRWLRDSLRELVLERQKALGYREFLSTHS